MYEIVSKRQFQGHMFQARLSGVPLGAWHTSKQLAVRDILRSGIRADVVDRSGVGSLVDRQSLGW
jgi:hypothetical protein